MSGIMRMVKLNGYLCFAEIKTETVTMMVAAMAMMVEAMATTIVNRTGARTDIDVILYVVVFDDAASGGFVAMQKTPTKTFLMKESCC
jgi:hypothetical protein